jgi:hypothetical protein
MECTTVGEFKNLHSAEEDFSATDFSFLGPPQNIRTA